MTRGILSSLRTTALLASIAAVALASSACGTHYITNLPLQWRGVDKEPQPSAAVAAAFSRGAIGLKPLQDKRPEINAVGRYDNESQPFTVRTTDNVATFYGTRMQEMLIHAGAKFDSGPVAWIEIELIELTVVEGGLFDGTAKIRVSVGPQAGVHAWTKDFDGRSKRWGRTHNPENFNESLANAFTEAMGKLLQDADFAQALGGTVPMKSMPVPPG